MASLCGEVMNRCVPIIVILGGTGTGKSKLGIQIAKRIGGEIISADSMQVYKGLNILTNKVTEDEKDGVVHHLMDFVVPPRTYTVVDFRNEALPIVDRLLEQKRCPVVVGGTNYYIESLLWKVLITNCTETSLVSENQNGMEKLAFRLGLRPFSGTFKRKVDDKDKTPLDVKGRLLLTVREVILMSNYPEKVFDILFDKLKSCTEDTCEKLVTSVCVRLGNNDDLLQKLKASIDDKHCQVVKKNLIEVVALGKQTKVLVEEWQTSNPTLNLEDALKTPDKVNLKDVCTVEESLQDVHQRLKSLIAPYVQRFVSEFGSAVRLEIDVEDLPSPDLHNFLIQVDEQQARYLHPNNKRKIVRSLVVWAESGRKHSDILNEQKRDGSFLGGPLRYKDTIIFWLTCDQEVLNARLDERIDQMIERGLVEELLDFYKKYKPGEDQYTKGIFQSIGFRNFRGYLSLDDEKRKGPEGEKMLQEGRELFRIDTKRYVKQQNKWVRNRFLNCPTREVPPVYNLSTTDIDRWTEDVLEPALEVVLDKLEGSEAAEGAARLLQPVAVEAASRQTVSEVLNLKHGLHYCDICQRTLVGQKQFDDHIQSARHRKAVRRKDNQANKAT